MLVLLLVSCVFAGAAAADSKTVTITFNANGGTGGSMTDQKVTIPDGQEAVTVQLKACGFTKDSDKFIGWKRGDSVYYTDKQSIKVTASDSAGITLTAQWSGVTLVKQSDIADGKYVIPSNGYYRLEENVTGTDPSGTIQVNSGVLAVLNLDGHVLNRTDSGSVITNNGVLTIIDSNASAGHFFKYAGNAAWTYAGETLPDDSYSTKFILTGSEEGFTPFTREAADTAAAAAAAAGKSVYIKVTGGCITGGNNAGSTGGGVSVIGSGTFNMSGGNIVGNSANSGGGVSVDAEGTFNMSGGSITGNTATLNGGGGVYVNGGTFTMSGGNIVGNTTTGGGGGVCVTGTGSKFEMSGGSITGNSADVGGGVDVAAGGSFEMSGTAEITGNSADAGGGVFVAAGGSFEMSGTAEITGNSAEAGGGVDVAGGTFKMSGGNIVGNSAPVYVGGGVYVEVGEFTMSGGNITGNSAEYGGGGVLVYSGTFKVSGTPVISGNTMGGNANNVWLAEDKYITVTGALQDDPGTPTKYAEIGIASPLTGKFGAGTTEEPAYTVTGADAACFFQDGIEQVRGVVTGSNDLYWPVAKIVTSGATPVTTYYATVADAVTGADTNDTITMIADSEEPTVEVDKTVTLDLNGHMLQYQPPTEGAKASVITVANNAKLTLTDNSTEKYHYFQVQASGPWTCVDSTVSDADKAAATLLENITDASQLTSGKVIKVTGGCITGGSASDGGGVYVNGGTFTMSGGNIVGNSTSAMGGGGGVFVDADGEFTLNSGSITGNSASVGGGVFVDADGEFTMSGGNIVGNSAAGGGGVVVAGEFTMSGGNIVGNSAPAYGGGVYVFDGTFTMQDSTTTQTHGTITGNSASLGGGGVYVTGESDKVGTFTMSGTAEITGNRATGTEEDPGCGGGVYVAQYGEFEMTGGTIGGDTPADGNTAKNGGGVFVAAGGTFNMSGTAEITGNTAPSNNGGGVFVAAGGTFNMSGTAEITGNSATGNGGGVFVDTNGTFNMSGGSITGNSALFGGGVVVYINSTFKVSGAPNISGNMKKNTASPNNVYLNGTDNLKLVGPLSSPAEIHITYPVDPTVSDGKFGTVAFTEGAARGPDQSDADRFVADSASPVAAKLEGNILKWVAAHAVSIDEDIQHGTVTASPTSAYSGATVTLTATPESGYKFESWDVKETPSSTPITVSNNTFTMHDSDVIVSATFIEVPPEPTTVTVTFNANGGIPESQDIVETYGNHYVLPETNPERSGYTFAGWFTGQTDGEKVTSGTVVKTAEDHILYAHWTKNSSGGSSSHSGSSVWAQPISTVPGDNTVATDVTYQYTGQKFIPVSAANLEQISAADPAVAAAVEMVLQTASAAGIPVTNSKGAKALVNTTESVAGLQTETFAQIIDVKSADGTKVTSVPFKVRLSDLTAKSLTTDDVTLYHYLEEYSLWIPLETVLVSTDDVYAYYEAATDGASPFGVLLKKIDAPEVQPVPTQTGATPAPVAGVLAGLGAALAVFGLRMRR